MKRLSKDGILHKSSKNTFLEDSLNYFLHYYRIISNKNLAVAATVLLPCDSCKIFFLFY